MSTQPFSVKTVWITSATIAVIVASFLGVYYASTLALAVAIGLLFGLVMIQRSLPAGLGIILVLIFCLPFERIPSVDIGDISIRISQVVGAVGLATLAVKIIYERWRLRPYPAALWLLGFFATALIGVVQAVNTEEAVQAYVFSLFTVFVSVIVVQFIRTTNDLRRVTAVLFPSTILVILFALYQTSGDIVGLPVTLTGLKQGYSKITLGFPRPQAFSAEPLYLANYLFLPLGVFGALWLGKLRGWNPRLLAACITGIVLVIVLTVSRGAYLAFIPFALTFVIFYPSRTVTVRALGTFLVVMSLVAGGTIGFLNYSRPDALEKFIDHATITDITEGESTQGRLAAFGLAYKAWQTKPVIGIGMGNFGPYVKGYPDPRTVTNWDIVNNEYLEILAETGLVGFGFMACFVLALLWRHIRALVTSRDPFHRAVLVGLLATFIAILTQYNFFSTLYILPIWTVVGLMVATQNVVLVDDEVGSRKQEARGKR